MSIVTTIENIVNALPITAGGSTYPTFISGEVEIINHLADEMYPVFIGLEEPINYTISAKQGGYKEKEFKTTLWIMQKTEFEPNKPQDHRPAIDAMTSLSNRFINRIESSESIRFVKGLECKEFKNFLDANFSGVMLKLSITPFNQDKACVS
jgi:hypothetical protein